MLKKRIEFYTVLIIVQDIIFILLSLLIIMRYYIKLSLLSPQLN